MSFVENRIAHVLNWFCEPLAQAQGRGFHVGSSQRLTGGPEAKSVWPCQPVQHTFVCGRSGFGKTTLFEQLMSEHLRLNIPFLFIDYHGQATERLLGLLGLGYPNHPFLVLEPWRDPVIGWNPLATKDESPYSVVQELISIFHRRLWAESWGPRLEELLRNTLLALAEVELTLLEAPAFLTRSDFRQSIVSRLSVLEVRDFWRDRFGRMSQAQQGFVIESVLNKLSAFHDPAIKYVIGQRTGSLDFEEALDRGQTVLINLSTGELRGNNFLLGALVVAKFKNAVYRRHIGAKRYSIFLDEFQEMVAVDVLEDYLRAFRKFSCSAYLATQHLRMEPELQAAIFGNCQRLCAFAVGARDARTLGQECGRREMRFVRDLLPELPVGHALCKVRGEPTQLLKVLAPPAAPSPRAIAMGRARCEGLGQRRAVIEHEIRQRTIPLRQQRPGDRSHLQLVRTEKAGASDLPEGYSDEK